MNDKRKTATKSGTIPRVLRPAGAMSARAEEPEEPVLDIADIQGIAVPGFLKPY